VQILTNAFEIGIGLATNASTAYSCNEFGRTGSNIFFTCSIFTDTNTNNIYTAGEGRLRRAFARHGASGVSGERRLPAGLSSVTYAYVAKLHALACLVAEPGRHGLSLPVDAFTPLEARRAPDGATRLDAVARVWGTTPESLARWNPAYRAGIALPGAPRRLLAPVGTATIDEAMASATSLPAAGAAPTANAAREHTVRSGETLWRIARRYGTTVRSLAAFNGLDPARPLRIGRTLRIPD
jgi:membrane-bound lytic murein transglycosylase D